MFGVGQPQICVLILRFGTQTPFSEKMYKNQRFGHGLGATRNSEADVPDVPDEPDEGKTVHDRHFGA